MNKNLFFELLQLSIGTCDRLSRVPTDAEWHELYIVANKHALVGVTYLSINRLTQTDLKINLCESLRLQWMGVTAKIQLRNKLMNEACARVCREFDEDGIKSVVLKGQSNLIYYPEDLRNVRTSGDIDLWCSSNDGINGVIEFCKRYERKLGRDIPWHRVLYYHCEMTSPDGIGIEVHYRPTYLNSPLRNHRLHNWFNNNAPWGLCEAQVDGYVFPLLPVSTNAVYQLLHIYKHLFEEGIGLRQLLDYYFVLRAFHNEQVELANGTSSMAHRADGMTVKSKEEIIHTLERFGMRKFAGAVMYVLQTVFAMPDECLLCPADEKEGKFLLNEIMMGGNFGKYDTRISRSTSQVGHAWEKLKHNFRLIRHYPEEVMWEPWFRVYHWFWRRLELCR